MGLWWFEILCDGRLSVVAIIASDVNHARLCASKLGIVGQMLQVL